MAQLKVYLKSSSLITLKSYMQILKLVGWYNREKVSNYNYNTGLLWSSFSMQEYLYS